MVTVTDVDLRPAEHLVGATAPFMAAAVVSILFWATPRARRQIDLLAVAGLWFATTLLVMLGNLRVVDDLEYRREILAEARRSEESTAR